PVRVDLLQNAAGNLDRVSAINAVHLRLRVRLDALHKVPQLHGELIDFLHVDLAHLQVLAEQAFFEHGQRGGVELPHVESGAAVSVRRLNKSRMPLVKIEADIALGRVNPCLPQLFGAGTAGSQVGDAAILKYQPGVGDVFMHSEQADADGLDR